MAMQCFLLVPADRNVLSTYLHRDMHKTIIIPETLHKYFPSYIKGVYKTTPEIRTPP